MCTFPNNFTFPVRFCTYYLLKPNGNIWIGISSSWTSLTCPHPEYILWKCKNNVKNFKRFRFVPVGSSDESAASKCIQFKQFRPCILMGWWVERGGCRRSEDTGHAIWFCNECGWCTQLCCSRRPNVCSINVNISSLKLCKL